MNDDAWELEIFNKDFNITSHFLTNDVNKSMVFACLYGLIFLFGIISNVIVIKVYMTSENSNNKSRFFFINLSISDIISLLICIPNAISDLFILNGWKFGFYYCNVLFYYLFLEFNSTIC